MARKHFFINEYLSAVLHNTELRRVAAFMTFDPFHAQSLNIIMSRLVRFLFTLDVVSYFTGTRVCMSVTANEYVFVLHRYRGINTNGRFIAPRANATKGAITPQLIKPQTDNPHTNRNSQNLQPT